MENNNEECKRPGMMLYFDFVHKLKMLQPLQRLAVYDAILEYGMDGTEPQLKGQAAMAWAFIKPILDRDTARYRKVVASKKKAALIRGQQIREEAEARKRKKLEQQLAADG